MAPMSHLFHLFHTVKTERKVTFFYGGRSKRELFYLEDFRKIERESQFPFHVVLSELCQKIIGKRRSIKMKKEMDLLDSFTTR